MTRFHVLSILIISILLLGALPAGAGKHSSKKSPIVTFSPSGPSSGVASEKIPTQDIRKCEGFSDRPHKSSHVGGTVNAQGRTKCPGPFPTIYVQSELLKDSKFIKASPAFANNNLRTIATANVNTNCPKNEAKFRINSYHYVVWPDFAAGAANTNNSANVNC